MKFLSFFRRQSSPTSTESDAIASLAQGMGNVPPDRARYIAGFALLLSRIAAADHEVTAQEATMLERVVCEKTGLPADQAALVVDRARAHQQRHGGTDDFLVTRELTERWSYDEKLAILDCLFAVAVADERIRAQESNEIGRIANELRIEQKDLAKVRHRYRDRLAVLNLP